MYEKMQIFRLMQRKNSRKKKKNLVNVQRKVKKKNMLKLYTYMYFVKYFSRLSIPDTIEGGLPGFVLFMVG